MDRFNKNPEPFLRKSASVKPAVGSETFRNYRAKTGHDARYGKALLTARISDLSSEVEIGQSEEGHAPLVVMSARADKRFSHDLRSNKVDMNRAYKRYFSSRAHYSDLNQESVLPESSLEEPAFKYKRHMKRASRDDNRKTQAYDKPMPFMDDEEDKEAIMALKERLMESRADATMHRGRDPTDSAGLSKEKDSIQDKMNYHRKINHLKEEKQKMYFKQFARVWEELKKQSKGKDTIFPDIADETSPASDGGQNQSDTGNTTTNAEGVNAFDSG